MKIAIIGAGAAGLVALKICLDDGQTCDVYEKTGNVGGTWNYVEKTGVDEYGLPIHSSMYEGLKTNLPKELMQFEGFPHKVPQHSYLTQTEVLKYINDYTEAFHLRPFIKFHHHVEKVTPLADTRWCLQIKDLQTQEEQQKEYDAVLVCIGNYSVPFTPKTLGIDNFRGSVIHSHDYRKSEPYKNRKVLIIGSGPSGIDIARLVKIVAEKTTISHRNKEMHPLLKLPDNVIIKPEVQHFKENSVIFIDGSEENIDDVIFCTGYIYSYPFLTPECGIEIENNWVKYLYKQLINIKYPTMAFMGIMFRVFPFVLFGIQVKFFLSYLKGNISITQKEMLDELMEYMKERERNGIPNHYAHKIGLAQGDYMDDLANTAGVQKVPPVYIKLYRHIQAAGRKGNTDVSYRIVSDEEFEEIR